MPIENDPEAPKKKQRGGKRPGAGAPKGNLNALKHGRRSEQFARIGALFSQEPKLREVLLILAEQHNAQRRRANQEAAALFVHLIETMQNASGRSFDLDHSEDWRSIKEEVAIANLKTLGKRLQQRRHPTDNQSLDTNPSQTNNPADTKPH